MESQVLYKRIDETLLRQVPWADSCFLPKNHAKRKFQETIIDGMTSLLDGQIQYHLTQLSPKSLIHVFEV